MCESQVLEEPTSEAREAPVQEMPDADDASLGDTSVKVDGAGPQPSDYIRGSLWDLMMRGTYIGVPGSTTPGDVAPAPGSTRVTVPGVSELLLPGSPSFPPPPIDWRWVGNDAEFTCSRFATMERLLQKMLASVNRNILRPIWVSMTKERKICLCTSGFLQALSSPPAFVSTAPVLVGRHCSGGHPRRGGTCYRDFYSGGCYGVG
jgi:hypothetical protein